ncbi:MAG: AAC(3) family N-acetyltransferase [Chloroflexi bacterium]|nr:AAC(3) family N-acetyltransferase [Chloroflexota bacterium]
MVPLESLTIRRLPLTTPGRVGYRDLVRGLREVGLTRHSRVVVHSSLSSFGQVAGGAATIVGALTAVCRTVVVPTFTYQTLVVPEVGPELNGMDYGSNGSYSPEFWRPNLPAHLDIGLVPNTLLGHWAAKRSSHPVLSFAAAGPDADELLAGQTLDDPFAPLKWLAERSGDVLLLGVTHRVNTTIHVAEERAGRKPFVRWALTPQKIVELAWPNDSSGFDAITDAINPHVIRGQIGLANVQRIPAVKLIEVAEALIQKDPTALLCHNPDCERCRDARARLTQI